MCCVIAGHLQTHYTTSHVQRGSIWNETVESERAEQRSSQTAVEAVRVHADADDHSPPQVSRRGTSTWLPVVEPSATHCLYQRQTIDCCTTATSACCLVSRELPCHQRQRGQHLCVKHITKI